MIGNNHVRFRRRSISRKGLCSLSNPRRAILYSKSYSAKLFVPAQLTDKKLQKSQLKWVLIGNLPLMTKRGHFILNGAPRVIVNQILRSPGIYFQGSLKEIFSEKWSEKPEISYKRFYTDLICLRGTWLRIEIDKNKDIWAQMKKIPKIPLLWFLLAMGLTERIIFKSVINPTRLLANFNLDIKRKINYEYVTNASDAWKEISNLISSKQNSFSSAISNLPLTKIKTKTKKKKFFLNQFDLELNKLINSSPSRLKPHLPGWTLANDLKQSLKEPLLQTQSNLSHSLYSKGSGQAKHDLLLLSNSQQGTPIDKAYAKKINLKRLVSFLKFSEQSKEGRNWIFKRFMNPRTYDLGKQGRLNFNRKLGLSISSNQTTLTAQDVLYTTDVRLVPQK